MAYLDEQAERFVKKMREIDLSAQVKISYWRVKFDSTSGCQPDQKRCQIFYRYVVSVEINQIPAVPRVEMKISDDNVEVAGFSSSALSRLCRT